MQSKKKHNLVYNETINVPMTNKLELRKISED